MLSNNTTKPSGPGSPWGKAPLAAIALLAVALTLAAGPAWTSKGRGRSKTKGDTATETPAPKAVKPAAKEQPAAKSQTGAKERPAAAANGGETELFTAERETLALKGVRCQVHHEGVIRQEMESKTGNYDEEAKILDLDQLKIKFQNEGTSSSTPTAGNLTCGYGRIWTKESREENISAHDMLLQQNVRLETAAHMVLTSPEMRYQAKDSTLHSDKGFRQQIPWGDSFVLGQGQQFNIKILPQQNTFGYWKGLGNPVELKKSDKPVFVQ